MLVLRPRLQPAPLRPTPSKIPGCQGGADPWISTDVTIRSSFISCQPSMGIWPPSPAYRAVAFVAACCTAHAIHASRAVAQCRCQRRAESYDAPELLLRTVQAANDSPVGSLSRATGLSRVRPGLAGSDAVGCNGQPDRRVASEFGRGAQNAATLAPLPGPSIGAWRAQAQTT